MPIGTQQKQDVSPLGAAPFFSEFPVDLVEFLQSAATLRKLKKNTHIIVSGEESHSVYVLVSGSAYAYTEDEDGNEFIVRSFGSGDCFGELGALDNKPRVANVKTTSECQCQVIPKATIMHAIKENPLAAMAVVRSLVDRIRGMTDDVSCLALMDVYGRLVRVLSNDAKPDAQGKLRTERMTHQELANRVGSSREMISKILKDLRTGGYIEIDSHRVVILKDLPERW